jgi:peptidoglycan/xylan/chitin deacetylase (PgdA/CDA1 family)
MSLGRDQDIVPVLTYHSVGMRHDTWIWRHLSERADIFARLLERLARAGYCTVTLDQLHAHMSGEERCPPKSIVLAFDDGYLDNWTTVAPLLESHGMRGTVYVNPEFVDPGSGRREQLRPDRAADGADVPDQVGFMNWDELRALDRSGTLDVQSHSLSHTWYPTGPDVEDGYLSATARQYPWMAWNARPERKPYYLAEDQSTFVAAGTPVFRHEKSLIARRFVPDSDRVEDVVAAFPEFSSSAPVGSEDWRRDYRDFVAHTIGDAVFPGSYETADEREARVRGELATSKALIEEALDKTVRYLCWPGGGTDPDAKRLAREVGYRSWTLPSREQVSKRNRPHDDPAQVKRLPALRSNYFFGRKWGQGTERLTMLDIYTHQDSFIHSLVRKAYKMAVAAGLAGDR